MKRERERGGGQRQVKGRSLMMTMKGRRLSAVRVEGRELGEGRLRPYSLVNRCVWSRLALLFAHLLILYLYFLSLRTYTIPHSLYVVFLVYILPIDQDRVGRR